MSKEELRNALIEVRDALALDQSLTYDSVECVANVAVLKLVNNLIEKLR